MITKKEFYFVRHGQTDSNVASIKRDCGDIPLNRVGVDQAHRIEPIVATLPVKTVCTSPLIRTKQTRDIACSRLVAAHIEVMDIAESTMEIWQEMLALGKNAHKSLNEPVYSFMQRVLKGMNQALLHEGPVLIVAHGGVHWAICCLMEIDEHDWIIENCIVTHFVPKEEGWIASKLNDHCEAHPHG